MFSGKRYSRRKTIFQDKFSAFRILPILSFHIFVQNLSEITKFWRLQGKNNERLARSTIADRHFLGIGGGCLVGEKENIFNLVVRLSLHRVCFHARNLGIYTACQDVYCCQLEQIPFPQNMYILSTVYSEMHKADEALRESKKKKGKWVREKVECLHFLISNSKPTQSL